MLDKPHLTPLRVLFLLHGVVLKKLGEQLFKILLC
jgi:predicted membrane chloride channel (bestrophin family)